MPNPASAGGGGGGRGPFVVLGLVSALAVGAISFVHYDQQKQRQVRGGWPWLWWCAFGSIVGVEDRCVWSKPACPNPSAL